MGFRKNGLSIFAIGAYPPQEGGGGIAGWNIVTNLAKLGHKITVFVEAKQGRKMKSPKNIKVVEIKLRKTLNVPDVKTFNLAKPLKRVWGLGGGIARKPFTDAIKKELKVRKPDVFLVNFGAPFLSFAQGIAKREGIPVTVVFHGSDVHNLTTTGFGRIKKTLLRQYERADSRIAVSNYLKNILAGMGVNEVTTIPNAVDKGIFRPSGKSQIYRVRNRLGLPHDAVVLSHVSSIRAIKNPLDIVEAGAKAIQKTKNLHFLIVGEGPLKNKMIKRARQLGIEKRIVFTGRANPKQVNQYINASDALVLPSQREGMPLVILEALSCGKPVIATKVGGIPEIVRNGFNGLLVEPRNIKQLADRMVLISNANVREKLSEGAISTAESLSLRVRTKEYLKAIKRGIERKKNKKDKISNSGRFRKKRR